SGPVAQTILSAPSHLWPSSTVARAKDPAMANTPSGRKLRKAAAEFEAQLLSSLWKSMKTSFTSSDDDSTDPAKQSLEEWGIDAMCNAVGKAGGLGIGKQIVHALESKMERLAAQPESQVGTSSFQFVRRSLL